MSTIIDPDTLDYNRLRDEMDKINEILKKKEAASKKITTTDQSSNLEKIQNDLLSYQQIHGTASVSKQIYFMEAKTLDFNTLMEKFNKIKNKFD